MLSVRDWSVCCFLHLRAAAAAVRELERWDLGLLRVLLLPSASGADKAEVLLFGLLRCEPMTLAVLPDVAPVAGHAMCPVIQILAMHSADRAVKEPVAFFLGELFQFLLVLLLLSYTLAFGDTFRFGDGVAVWAL